MRHEGSDRRILKIKIIIHTHQCTFLLRCMVNLTRENGVGIASSSYSTHSALVAKMSHSPFVENFSSMISCLSPAEMNRKHKKDSWMSRNLLLSFLWGQKTFIDALKGGFLLGCYVPCGLPWILGKSKVKGKNWWWEKRKQLELPVVKLTLICGYIWRQMSR